MRIKDHEIVEGLRKGDEMAFEQLFNKYSHPLLNHIYKITGKKEISEEILNDSFMTIIKKINFYKEHSDKQASFKPWIFRIATNESIDYLRKEKRRKKKFELVSEEDGFKRQKTPDECLSSLQNEKIILKLMMELPTIQKIVLNLKVKEEMTYLEISHVCGCNINSVKQALYKARVNLKKKLLLCEDIV